LGHHPIFIKFSPFANKNMLGSTQFSYNFLLLRITTFVAPGGERGALRQCDFKDDFDVIGVQQRKEDTTRVQM
jgi:hypothetical protein